MTPLLVGLVGLVLMVGLLVSGLHIGVALGVIGFVGLWSLLGFSQAMTLLEAVPFEYLHNYVLVVIPLFIVMGTFIIDSGLASKLYEAAYKMLSGMPGSLSMATILACGAFGAVSGSSVAACAIFTKLSLGEMLKRGYAKSLAAGSIVSAGGLAALIPPSAITVLYAMFTDISIGRALIAGIIPGMISVVTLSAVNFLLVKWKPALAPPVGGKIPMGQRWQAVIQTWPILPLIVIIWGGIYSGVFTATESAGIAAFITLVYLLVAKRKSPLKPVIKASLSALRTTAMIFIIIIGAALFARFITVSRLGEVLTEFVVALSLNRMAILAGFIIMYLILGCFLDSLGIMAITLPVVAPILSSLGFDLVWFGVIFVVLLEVGMITPPFGLNLFVVQAASGGKVSIGEIFKGGAPFIIGHMAVVGLVIVFPQLALWLPSMMKG